MALSRSVFCFRASGHGSRIPHTLDFREKYPIFVKITILMKRLSRLLLLLGLCILCSDAFARKFPNYPIPQRPDTLRILGIGNSFTEDGMEYLPDLLEAAGIGNVILGRITLGGCSLERHCQEYAADTDYYTYCKSTHNRWETVLKKARLRDGIADERWDIVILQQVSGKAGLFLTYEPWLGHLVEIVRLHCPNAGACIGWQQTWAYAPDSNHGDFSRYDRNQQLMYEGIVAAVKQLRDETSIEVVIPTGTAIQNLRGTQPADAPEVTRDGFHLNFKTGRYTAACTWFETLVAPALRTTVAENECRLRGTPHELTGEEAAICRQAAQRACIRNYSAWTENKADEIRGFGTAN